MSLRGSKERLLFFDVPKFRLRHDDFTVTQAFALRELYCCLSSIIARALALFGGEGVVGEFHGSGGGPRASAGQHGDVLLLLVVGEPPLAPCRRQRCNPGVLHTRGAPFIPRGAPLIPRGASSMPLSIWLHISSQSHATIQVHLQFRVTLWSVLKAIAQDLSHRQRGWHAVDLILQTGT